MVIPSGAPENIIEGNDGLECEQQKSNPIRSNALAVCEKTSFQIRYLAVLKQHHGRSVFP